MQQDQPDFVDSQIPRRRKYDPPVSGVPAPGDACEVGDNIWSYVLALSSELDKAKQRIILLESAFVLDDLHSPDYGGHRKAHLEAIKQSAVIKGYTQDATKKVVATVVVFLLGVMATGFLNILKIKML